MSVNQNKWITGKSVIPNKTTGSSTVTYWSNGTSCLLIGDYYQGNGGTVIGGLAVVSSTTTSVIYFVPNGGTVIGGINNCNIVELTNSGTVIGGINNCNIVELTNSGTVTGGIAVTSLTVTEQTNSGTVIGGIAVISLAVVIAGKSGTVIGGTNNCNIVELTNSGTVTGGIAVIYSSGAITDYTNGGVVTGGTNNCNIVELTKSGTVTGGANNCNIVELTKSGTVTGGTNNIKITNTVFPGSIYGGSSGVTFIGYILTIGGGILFGGNYTTNYITLGGCVISGLGCYSTSGIILGGNAAKTFNLIYNPSGGISVSSITKITISFNTFGGLSFGGLGAVTYYYTPSNGIVISSKNTDQNLIINEKPKDGFVAGGKTTTLIKTSCTGGLIFCNNITLQNIITGIATTGLIVGSKTTILVKIIGTGELVACNSELRLSYHLNTIVKGGLITSGTAGCATYGITGLVISGKSKNILNISFSSKASFVTTVNSYIKIKYIYTVYGGLVSSSISLFNIIHNSLGIVCAGISPVNVSLVNTGGLVIGNSYLSERVRIIYKVSNGIIVSGNCRSSYSGVANGIIVGGSTTLNIIESVNSFIVFSGYVLSEGYLFDSVSEGGLVVNGYSISSKSINVNYTSIGNVIFGGTSPNAVVSGMTVGSTTPIIIVVSCNGGITVNTTSIKSINIKYNTLGGLAYGGNNTIIVSERVDTIIVVSGTTNTVLIVAPSGGLAAKSSYNEYLVLPVSGGISSSSEDLPLDSGIIIGGTYNCSNGLVVGSDRNIPISVNVTTFNGLVLSSTLITEINTETSGGVLIGGGYIYTFISDSGIVFSDTELQIDILVIPQGGSTILGVSLFVITAIWEFNGGVVFGGRYQISSDDVYTSIALKISKLMFSLQ